MNILMALSQREVTGAEVYAVTLTHELMARGHKVYVVSDTLTTPCQAPFFPIIFNRRSLKERTGHVRQLLHIIKKYDIQVVHAHSRASSWSCTIACKIAGIPLITSTHGRQPVHLSRKLFKGFGSYSICVCENIQTQICRDLGMPKERTLLLRNPVDPSLFAFHERNNEYTDAPVKVALIGRLSGPKGTVALKVLETLSNDPRYDVSVIGGNLQHLPDAFKPYQNLSNVHLLGYQKNVNELIVKADVIIGAGRVGIEAILTGRPMIAIGEALYEGLVTPETLPKVLSSNFGDINSDPSTHFYYERLKDDIEQALKLSAATLKELCAQVTAEYSLNHITDTIERLYSSAIVQKRHYELPVIMYHRVIASDAEKGIHGTYVTKEQFRAHLQHLKDKGYQTVTFEELSHNRYKERFNRGNKWVILTFDDGYEDNYRVMFPILKEFQFKATIFLLSDRDYNSWDADNKEHPEKRLNLMTDEQIKEMMDYGIEFGAHSRTHPRLANIPAEQARDEITTCKAKLEQRFNRPFTVFAYPYGSLNEEVKEMVRQASFEFAVATDSGDITFDHDLLQIRRIAIFPGNTLHTFRRKVSGWYNFIKIRREQRQK